MLSFLYHFAAHHTACFISAICTTLGCRVVQSKAAEFFAGEYYNSIVNNSYFCKDIIPYVAHFGIVLLGMQILYVLVAHAEWECRLSCNFESDKSFESTTDQPISSSPLTVDTPSNSV